MNWYYAKGTEKVGPVSESEVRNQHAAGAITNDSLVWGEGMAEWKPYGQVFGGAPAAAPDSANPYQAPASAQANATMAMKPVSIEVPLDRNVSARRALKQGLSHVFSAKFWPLFGVCFVLYLILGVASQLGATIAVQSPIMAGMFYYALLQIRGENPVFGDGFAGFNRNLGALIIHNLIIVGVSIVAMLVGAGIFFGGNFEMFQDGYQPTVKMAILGGIAILVIFIPLIYFSFIWAFAIPLLVDKEIGIGAALRDSKTAALAYAKSLIGYFLLSGLIMFGFYAVIGGIFAAGMATGGEEAAAGALIIGFLLAIPLLAVFGLQLLVAFMHIYNDIFGDSQARYE